MTECESVRGQWGGICPDCGQMQRKGKPIKSWMATRHNDEKLSVAAKLRMRPEYTFRLHRLEKRKRAA